MKRANKFLSILLIVILVSSFAACDSKPNDDTNSKDFVTNESSGKENNSNDKSETADNITYTAEPKEATEATKEKNNSVKDFLDFNDETEVEFAKKGLLVEKKDIEIKDEDGVVVWSQKAYGFLEENGSDTANPSLWRHSQMNHYAGLFEVSEGIYQVRGYDMANVTFVESDGGWIVLDPLLSVECMTAAKQLVDEHFGEKLVKGIIISHSHVDHFGGIKGLVTDEYVQENNIPIIAPLGFEEGALNENIYTVNAMTRRAMYMYGVPLDPGEQGHLSIGIGQAQSRGHTSWMKPTKLIGENGDTEEITIDGVKMEFQYTPNTEAPAEMHTWFPDKNALWLAENCTGTLHNISTFRGAQVRDAGAWSQYIMDTLTKYGDKAEVVFQAHNWPHWGNDLIQDYLINTASAYKYINDQTLMYINQGYTDVEIANLMSELPGNLAKVWYTRQYYGTVSHNAQAVYQRYMSWYNANPVNILPLTPEEAGKKYLEYIEAGGDASAILKKAKQDFDRGEYRWVAEITNRIVFADPDNKDARYLCADALEQLGYQAESSAWRNAYLTGAKELREGATSDLTLLVKIDQADTFKAINPVKVFDYLSIAIDSDAAKDVNLKINVKLDGEGEYLLTMHNGVLLSQKDVQDPDADATITAPKMAFIGLVTGQEGSKDLVKIDGDATVIEQMMKHAVKYDPLFNIVEP